MRSPVTTKVAFSIGARPSPTMTRAPSNTVTPARGCLPADRGGPRRHDQQGKESGDRNHVPGRRLQSVHRSLHSGTGTPHCSASGGGGNGGACWTPEASSPLCRTPPNPSASLGSLQTWLYNLTRTGPIRARHGSRHPQIHRRTPGRPLPVAGRGHVRAHRVRRRIRRAGDGIRGAGADGGAADSAQRARLGDLERAGRDDDRRAGERPARRPRRPQAGARGLRADLRRRLAAHRDRAVGRMR